MKRPEQWSKEALESRSASASTCPLRRLEVDAPWVWDVLADLRAYQRHGTLWTAGGIGDQPALWWQRVQVALAADLACDREEDEERERKRKAEAARSKARR